MTRTQTEGDFARVRRDQLPNEKETSVKGRCRRSQRSFPEGITDEERRGRSTKKETTSGIDESSPCGVVERCDRC